MHSGGRPQVVNGPPLYTIFTRNSAGLAFHMAWVIFGMAWLRTLHWAGRQQREGVGRGDGKACKKGAYATAPSAHQPRHAGVHLNDCTITRGAEHVDSWEQ